MEDTGMDRATELDPLSPAERSRSDFVRDIVQRRESKACESVAWSDPAPKHIVQFWDDLQRLPEDVKSCMDSWKALERDGFTIDIFDKTSAGEFIRNRLGSRHENAFNKCYHPSMMSDYFRYSYVFVEGGFYIDADDVYHGTSVDRFFVDGRLKLQPFCYDIATSQMVDSSIFTKPGASQPGWIFYFNNAPLIASPRHPIVERALLNATLSLESEEANGLPEIQATTGPGNLTRSVFEVMSEDCSRSAFMVAHDWDLTSTSQWLLSYRNDARNWRLSNQKAYRAPSLAEAQ
jgi:hypothetical protein